MFTKIKKRSKKILTNKIFVFLAILFLGAFWFGASLLFNNEVSFSTIVHSYENRAVNTDKLLKGDIYKDEFTAKENYLGIVRLRFEDFPNVDYEIEDVLIFRIKEKGEKEWYAENSFRTGALKNSLFYPFGFHLIDDSKDKTFEFEIESTAGKGHNSIQISDGSNILKTSHIYPRWEITGDTNKFIQFGLLKTYNSLTDTNFLLSSIFFALPLIVFLLLYLVLTKPKLKNKGISVFVIFLILYEIFFLDPIYSGLFLMLGLFWIISIKINKLSYKASLYVFIMLFIIWMTLSFFDMRNYSDKLNVWAYFFFTTAAFHLFIESYKQLKAK